ncbi:MAG: PilZ domain-containing protein [Myxococcales bacterium]|nr:PilZ domain-containing protein [Myxococcales bacterium]USN50396.1 MAG: PilZ domain-containing protein [Myxococcales bacterium]
MSKKADIPQPGEAKASEQKPTRHLRAPIEIRIEVTLGPQSFTATSRNLAIGGVSFETLEELSVGDQVNILLYIPVSKDIELLKISSEVVWSEDQSGSWMVGAKFVKFAPGDQKRLREWLLECVRAIKAGKPIV